MTPFASAERALARFALAIAGGFLIMKQVQVTSGYWRWWGTNTFGLTLFPLVIGIGLLFFNGKSIAGWLPSGRGQRQSTTAQR